MALHRDYKVYCLLLDHNPKLLLLFFFLFHRILFIYGAYKCTYAHRRVGK